MTPVPQSRRDLLQAVTEGLVLPTGLSTTQLGCAGACMVRYGPHLHVTAGLGYFHACHLHYSAAASADLTGTRTGTRTGLAKLMLRLMQGQLETNLAGRGAGRKERREGAHVLNLL